MAEAWLNALCGDRFAAESAGLEPGTINPVVVEVMREAGIDLSQKKTQAVFDVWKSGKLFQYVIAVCAESEEKGCPIFPGVTTRLSWPFPDPSRVEGTDELLPEAPTSEDWYEGHREHLPVARIVKTKVPSQKEMVGV